MRYGETMARPFVQFIPLIAAGVTAVGSIIASDKGKKAASDTKKAAQAAEKAQAERLAAEKLKAETAAKEAAKNAPTESAQYDKYLLYGGIGLGAVLLIAAIRR